MDLRLEPQKREDEVELSLLIAKNESKQWKQTSLPSNGNKFRCKHLLETLLLNIECGLIQPQKLSYKITPSEKKCRVSLMKPLRPKTDTFCYLKTYIYINL